MIDTYGLSGGQIAAIVAVFVLIGWGLGKLHEVVLWPTLDRVGKAKVIQGALASFTGGALAFGAATFWLEWPLLGGVSASLFAAYLGIRVIDAVAELGLDGLKAAATRFLDARKTP